MRNLATYFGAAAWLALATLLPMAALEPVVTAAQSVPVQVAGTACAEAGSAALRCRDARL